MGRAWALPGRGARLLAVVLAVSACHVLGTAPAPELRSPPRPAEPADSAGAALWRAAKRQPGPRIVVSLKDRWLWLVSGRDTLLSAPVAVGMGRDFTFRGKRYHFATPRGERRVIRKEEDPVWVPPDWHYYEKAARRGLEVVHLEPGDRHVLSDGTAIEVRGNVVGRVNQYGNFWPWTPGMELVFDDTIFVPPIASPQRRVPNALGEYKLDMGDGYLIHGTHRYNRDSIGRAVSHGCVRMRNEDLERLYGLVEVGTPVYIY